VELEARQEYEALLIVDVHFGRNQRLRAKTAFLRFPPVHTAALEGQQRVQGV
jgi:hypothetical protein